jgi:hypothetical protein
MNGPGFKDEGAEQQPSKTESGRGRGHWLMMLCCVPMVIVAIALVASGTSLVPLLIALVCAALMAGMMLAVMRG